MDPVGSLFDVQPFHHHVFVKTIIFLLKSHSLRFLSTRLFFRSLGCGVCRQFPLQAYSHGPKE